MDGEFAWLEFRGRIVTPWDPENQPSRVPETAWGPYDSRAQAWVANALAEAEACTLDPDFHQAVDDAQEWRRWMRVQAARDRARQRILWLLIGMSGLGVAAVWGWRLWKGWG